MKKSSAHKKITISIPKELDDIITAIVEASKTTTHPITKSAILTSSAYEYLYNANLILKKSKKEENN